jgi:hypothetical protein
MVVDDEEGQYLIGFLAFGSPNYPARAMSRAGAPAPQEFCEHLVSGDRVMTDKPIKLQFVVGQG